MIDFERTHRMRRAIYQALQQSQKLESQVAEHSAKIAVDCKRDLLIYLSAWLLELNSVSALTATEREEIQSLTQMSLGEWIQLQTTVVQLEKDLNEAKGKEREAIAFFERKAPHGWATKVFADAESKAQITNLHKNVVAAQKHRESRSKAIEKNVKRRQELGERFFCDCLRQWDKLASTQALGKEAGLILNRMTTENNAIWVEHQKRQTEELGQVSKLMENLHTSYKDIPATPPQQRKVPSPQKESNADIRQGNSYDFEEK